MRPKGKNKISETELKIMRIIWELESCAARDVLEAARKEEDWSESTVKTLLRRLVDKGYLNARLIGNSFLYTPTKTLQSQLKVCADNLIHFAKQGTIGSVIAYLIQQSKLSKDDLTELEDLIDNAKKKDI